MIKQVYDVVVIGSGPGGVAAGIAAKKAGAEDVLILERDVEPGGILLQCIHNGFGMENLGEDLPGPSYAQRYIIEAQGLGIVFLLETMVLDITHQRKIIATNKYAGIIEIQARAIVLGMGCRERTRAQIRLPGSRPAGVYTAGTAQRWVNIEGYMPGNNIVILGSGDIGMIMARRLTFEGAHVERVLEIMPFLSGLSRNYVQCLLDYDIPLQLQHTVKRIIGNDRIEAVETTRVDDRFNPIAGTEEIIPCDTLLLSVGLIPENELSRKAGVAIDPNIGGPYVDDDYQTSVPGIFAAGNVVHVYDLADWVTQAGFRAGENAAFFAIKTRNRELRSIPTTAGKNVRYVIPQQINKDNLAEKDVSLQLRVRQPIEAPSRILVKCGDEVITSKAEMYARPGEMISIDLKPKHYDVINSACAITVDVVERE
ncbi:MAG: FAD-dependent oxidoreductase [Anaerolineae bacterium]|nr:FAD-dependent oxidoreductase [Anaerolineae bacterium]